MRLFLFVSIIAVFGLFAFSFVATPALAGPPDKTDGFVCPVIKTNAVLNSPRGGTLGASGDYTIGGPDVHVPIHATNGDGAGVPPGPHSAPGDTDYTAIWANQ